MNTTPLSFVPRLLALALLIGLALPSSLIPSAAAASSARAPAPISTDAKLVGYALVVANNRSLDKRRANLRYADDDGARWAELFDERFGAGHTQLLTRFDDDSKPLFPAAQRAAMAPTRAALDRAVQTIHRHVKHARLNGKKTEVWVVLAGHGDTAGGRGFFELEDSRLDAAALERALIDRLPADRVHLIVDACHAWQLVQGRKPGGQRFAIAKGPSVGLTRRHPNLGVLFSASTQAVSWEWSEVQGGIFSYEMRSALRGAADADGDGVVTYREVAAFVASANQKLVNAAWRPRVFAAPPRGSADAPLMRLAFANPRRLQISAAGARRLTIRDGRGLRLLDVHKAHGTPLTLHLPARDRDVVAYERIASAAGVKVWARELPRTTDVDLAKLGRHPPSAAPRGEAPVFRDLFAAPFGRAVASAFQLPTARDAAAQPLPTPSPVAKPEPIDAAAPPPAVPQRAATRPWYHSTLGWVASSVSLPSLTVGLLYARYLTSSGSTIHSCPDPSQPCAASVTDDPALRQQIAQAKMDYSETVARNQKLAMAGLLVGAAAAGVAIYGFLHPGPAVTMSESTLLPPRDFGFVATTFRAERPAAGISAR